MPSLLVESIYLDNAATTQLDEEALKVMAHYWRISFGNPSSLHVYGRDAKRVVEKSRKAVAELLAVRPSMLIFTGGYRACANHRWFRNGSGHCAGRLWEA